jgi:peptide/nickel transport system substrate-binding protein
MQSPFTQRLLGALAFAAALVALPAAGQELKIAVAADVTSIDPHFLQPVPEQQRRRAHLRQAGADGPGLEDDPGLATSWKAIDDKTWEFKLRKGVKFHDGSELTAEDVAFSIDRVPQVPNSPGPFSAVHEGDHREGDRRSVHDPVQVRGAVSAVAERPVDDLHRVEEGRDRRVDRGLQLRQGGDRQRPLQVRQLRQRRSRRARAQRQLLGREADWDKVTFKIIKNEAARVAALLSGDVDAIEQPPTADLRAHQGDPKFTVTSKISHRVIYFNFDHLERSSPFITDKDGKPLAKNPLLDARVRRRSPRRSTARRSPTA